MLWVGRWEARKTHVENGWVGGWDVPEEEAVQSSDIVQVPMPLGRLVSVDTSVPLTPQRKQSELPVCGRGTWVGGWVDEGEEGGLNGLLDVCMGGWVGGLACLLTREGDGAGGRELSFRGLGLGVVHDQGGDLGGEEVHEGVL